MHLCKLEARVEHAAALRQRRRGQFESEPQLLLIRERDHRLLGHTELRREPRDLGKIRSLCSVWLGVRVDNLNGIPLGRLHLEARGVSAVDCEVERSVLHAT